MIGFAPVMPLDLHEQVRDMDPAAHGLYHLVVATEVLKDPIGYNRFWMNVKGEGRTVILDNGVIERGASLTPSLLAAAAVLVDADVVILPDVIGDADATIHSAEAALSFLLKYLPKHVQFMGVGQGKDWPEVHRCLGHLANTPGIDWLSLPKGFRERGLGHRGWALRQMVGEWPDKKWHVLGLTDDYEDDVSAATCAEQVKGIDSATPIWAAVNYETFRLAPDDHFNPKGRRPADYLDWDRSIVDERGEENVWETIVQNITTVRGWLDLDGPTD